MQILDVEPFAAFLTLNNRRKSTVVRHVYSLKTVLRGIDSFSLAEVDRFLAALKTKGLKATYINSLINTVCVYAQWKGIEELSHLKHLKEEEFIKATMSDEEIEAFLNLPPLTYLWHKKSGTITKTWDSKKHEVWTLFFGILAYTGLRPGECAALAIEDVDFGRMVFTVRVSKTGHGRVVPIPPNLLQPLQRHIEALKGNILFPGVNNVDWHYNFQQRIKRLGIKRTNLSAYSLRHSFISNVLGEGAVLFDVQSLVGHKDIRTTAHYYHLSLKSLKKAQEKHSIIRKSAEPQQVLKGLVDFFKELSFDRDPRFTYRLEETESGVKIEVDIKK
jgi:integrase